MKYINSFIDVLEVMLNAMKIQEESWEEKEDSVFGGHYTKSLTEGANEFMGLDPHNKIGQLTELFCHWYNDVQDSAAYIGFTFGPNGEIVRPQAMTFTQEQLDWAKGELK